MIKRILLGLFLVGSFVADLRAQSDLKLENLPRYEQYKQASQGRRSSRGSGVRDVKWAMDGSFVNFTVGGTAQALDLKTAEFGVAREGKIVVSPPTPVVSRKSPVGRAEQRTVEPSPDGKWNAVYRDNNVFIEAADGTVDPVPVTKDGIDRLRYGTGCWVYGEELDQSEAMWWSPDGKSLVFYEVDEQGLKDYYLTTDNTSTYTQLHVTRYPKAGEDNPQVNLMHYNLDTKEIKRFNIEGEERQYLFDIAFAPNGKELLVHRTNRRQDVLDLLAIDVATGKSRVVVTEKQSTWQENSPTMRFLNDGERFIWQTESNGWHNFQLRHIDGRLLNALTNCDGFPCERIVNVDEDAGVVYYTAYSDQMPYSEQLHRVNLDGTQDVRITTSPLHHSQFEIDPKNRFVLARREKIDIAPEYVVYSTEGKELAVLPKVTEKDDEAATSTEACHSESFSFMSSDGSTKLWGTLHFPSDFDATKKYPLLIDVYGGPQSRGLTNNYQPINAVAELGFIVAKIGNRGTVGRGKAFESATYQRLGDLDLLDQATGVRHLTQREYIDGNRVGIYGHSYGGYMSAMALLRHPDVFHVAVAGAPVTDWRNYDSIYTERFMRTPQENSEGYDQSSCMKYVENLTGKLLIVHGLIDDNVHPANTWQLIKALEEADKRFDLMIYPGFKHGIGSNYNSIRLEYLYRHLIAESPAISAPTNK